MYGGPPKYPPAAGYGRPDAVMVSRRHWSPLGVLCSCVICCFALVIFALGLFILVALIVIHPVSPRFSLQNLDVQDLKLRTASGSSESVSGIVNGLQVDADLNATISARNSNDFSIYYDRVNLTLIYQNITLGKANISSFSQPSHSNATIPALITVREFPLVQGTALGLTHAISNDEVNLTAVITVSGHVKIWGIVSPIVKANVTCNVTASISEHTIGKKTCQLTGVGVNV